MADEQHDHGPPSVAPDKVKIIIRILMGVCAAVVIADGFYDKHGHYSWEHYPGFHAVYGFVSCVLLVILATQMRRVVMRDEEYYDRD